jgi:hypothetical protein
MYLSRKTKTAAATSLPCKNPHPPVKQLAVSAEKGELPLLIQTVALCKLFHLALWTIAGLKFLDNSLHFFIRKDYRLAYLQA